MDKTFAHIISHTHWDREWYMPFEKHHVKLVQLMDNLLYLFENDPEFKSFHLDGQTIVLDDYLQVRPEKKELLAKYVKEGKLRIGPWYILQDEFLTSSEANIRNLLVGMQMAKSYGAICPIGYLPDSFGNIGQAPQIFKQAGLKAAVFGRGVKPVGYNNKVMEHNDYESVFSEMYWQSPDGSEILGILFANWYNNGSEIPADPQKAQEYWSKRLSDAGRFASGSHYLFMNGCDHQPVQMDLSQALSAAKQLYPDVEFVHSNFEDYVDAATSSLTQSLTTVKGELTSQDTDGWWTLVGTTSARIYLKQLNQKNQMALEKVAEPLAVFSYLLGNAYPHHLLTYAWKVLMQNHPHDSICGCSVDEVHREMITRFNKSIAFTEEIIAESLRQISSNIDTTVFENLGDESVPFVVYNTTGWDRTGVVYVEVDIARVYSVHGDSYSKMENIDCGGWSLIDCSGRSIAFTMEDLHVKFGYDLPDDKFRQPYFARRVKLTFEAEKMPGLGFGTYALVKNLNTSSTALTATFAESTTESLVTGVNQMQNSYLSVSINRDGTLDIADKTTGRTYTGLCYYEDAGDIGNEYTFMKAKGEAPLTTSGNPAEIRLIEDKSYRAVYEITQWFYIPRSADDQLTADMTRMTPFHKRSARRSIRNVELKLVTYVTLEKGSRALKVKTVFDNCAKDHRLRVMFPTNANSETHYADSIFEVPQRNNKPSKAWTNPSNCQHQQAFVSIDDGKAGLTIANFGLHEYEVLRDDANTIAVTLLRAVGELGDWGVFPTPDAQCLGEQTAEFEIIPHEGSFIDSSAFVEAYQFQVPWTTCQTKLHAGRIPARHSFMEWDGNALALSGVKISEETGDVILRWFNTDSEEHELNVKLPEGASKAYLSNVIEECVSDIEQNVSSKISVPVGKAQIITLGLKLK